MASPRSLTLTVAIAAGIAACASGSALAAPGAGQQGPARVNVARTAAERSWTSFMARQAARDRPHSVPATAPKSLAGTATGGAAGSGIRLRVTNVKQTSRDTLPALTSEIEPDTQTEPMVAIDPARPNVMTAVIQQGRNGPFGGSADPGYATSHNGGVTWTDGNFPQLTTVVGGPFALASDPVAAFGPDGSDYIQTIAFGETDARSAVTVQRSADGGITFGKVSLVTDDNDVNIFNDKNWIAVDSSPASPFFGRIYSVWSRFITTGTGASAVTTNPGAVSFSDNHGKTWSPIHFTSPLTDEDEGLIPLIHKDGAITVVYDRFVPSATNPNAGNDFETAQTSHDGGVTWGPQVTIGQFLGSEVPGMRTGGLPAAAIDPVTGDMYTVWQDARFNSAGLNDVAFSVSTDGGLSWSAPRAVDPEVAGLDRFTPAVAAFGGKVYVSYRTRGASGAAPTVTEDLVASADGGRTFGREHQVGPASQIQWAAVSDEAPPPVAFYGDYMGLSATSREAELAWAVSSPPPGTGQFHQALWGATIIS
jgi:hypothetical protein